MGDGGILMAALVLLLAVVAVWWAVGLWQPWRQQAKKRRRFRPRGPWRNRAAPAAPRFARPRATSRQRPGAPASPLESSCSCGPCMAVALGLQEVMIQIWAQNGTSVPLYFGMWQALWTQLEKLMKRSHLPCCGSPSFSRSRHPIKRLLPPRLAIAAPVTPLCEEASGCSPGRPHGQSPAQDAGDSDGAALPRSTRAPAAACAPCPGPAVPLASPTAERLWPLPGAQEEAGHKKELWELYQLGPQLLGSGGFGTVFSGTRLSDGSPVAIKRMARDTVLQWDELPDGTCVPTEIVLMKKVGFGCRRIIQLLDWFELPDSFVLVLERPEQSRDLLRVLVEQEFLSEEAARWLFWQVLEAVWHCTACGVLHRDIKPENLLVNPETGELMLIDFGCGTFLQERAYTEFAGTRSYCPPEWIGLRCYHGDGATIWSLGVLLFEMMCGFLPFENERDIVLGQPIFPQEISPECQHLIRWCLSKHAIDRPVLEQIFYHPWVLGGHS
ncbi:PREDICTED: LOW QUALITY PROTEIN: serine/threonine-protein kinase pim-1-like [Pseudopodoces humilis]|uniref:LOW QUALITY PROTEIN: serine/threonine-protein kinase pim-1-like n=1 Tax=Pseudopodoces humilis TaxID=181119 RepID=UPI0006B84492|nr:PREDICTED: LOW QUALITY PROTEIN: serine/threonine-protein kinase pim-1-like [Pseudopodoces humilis]